MAAAEPGVIAKHVSKLQELRSFQLSGPMQLNGNDSDALCRLPNLETLRLAINFGSVAPSSTAAYCTPPSIEAIKHLTKLMELSALATWGTDEVLLRFQNLNCLTSLYV